MKKKGFTLIELIAVLVILAILALIVTPLVMNIIRKARISADKRSIDAYGRSVELAIANYLLDNGDFPTDISQLQVEYTGDEVVCTTTQINTDSSVYLAGCTVGGRSVDYIYGIEEVVYDYRVGDEVTYNNINYFVIKDSISSEKTVTLLKAEPLTVAEVNQYGVGHVNMYVTNDTSASYYKKAYNQNGYGGMAYYSSTSCGNNYGTAGCTTNYDQSEIKFVVDAWSQDSNNFEMEALVADNFGYKARLLKHIELVENLGYADSSVPSDVLPSSDGTTPDFIWNSQYSYWTMEQYISYTTQIWGVTSNGNLRGPSEYYYDYVVRPVITIKKSALE